MLMKTWLEFFWAKDFWNFRNTKPVNLNFLSFSQVKKLETVHQAFATETALDQHGLAELAKVMFWKIYQDYMDFSPGRRSPIWPGA